MRILSKEQLKVIIELHHKYLQGESDGVLADLRFADLRSANLSFANLRSANLRSANLSFANLSFANLSSANLRSANLRSANLSFANLSSANLSFADLTLEKIIHMFTIVPEEGPFYAYKKLQNEIIATLYVPRSAKRLGGLIGRKCRVSKAKVVSLSAGTKGYDKHTGKLLYKVGKWIIPDRFDDDAKIECSHGIHVFLTKKEAEEY